MAKQSISALNRRHFLSFVALGTFSLLTKDLLYPASAQADSGQLANKTGTLETYHIYVPYTTAKKGGNETFLLRSGDSCTVQIPPKSQDNQEITIGKQGEKAQDIRLVIHTLYARNIRLGEKIYQEIDSTQFIKNTTKNKCKQAYEQVEETEDIDDLIALDLLDYVISSSKLEPDIKQRYQLASTNSRLLAIEQTIETALGKSKLPEKEKKLIRGTFAYVRAGEPVPDFKALTDIDSIVANSALASEIKKNYSLASATSRGLTVDFILVKEITENKKLTEEQRQNYLSTYQQVRDGKEVEDEANLKSLDSFIENAKIPQNAKTVYSFARKEKNLENKGNLAETVNAVTQYYQDIEDKVKDGAKKGSSLVPNATRILTTMGAETATGVSISTLSGAAATNATLAFLGGGSVASGGLGMLGGLAVATGGAALIGAAGIVSFALVSQMDNEDKKNLGIAIGSGTILGSLSVLGAWTAASAFGVAGTLSGAAALSTTIAALGGLGVITGGAAFVASGTAFAIWSFLQAGKTREQSSLHQLEARTYTYTEETIKGDFAAFISQNLKKEEYTENNISLAPSIPLDKLSNALSGWLNLSPEEKVVALIDTSIAFLKKGIVFSENRLHWTYNVMDYQDLARFFKTETKITSLLSDATQKQNLSKLKKVLDILADPKYASNLSKMQELVAVIGTDKNLSELVSNEKYKGKLAKLKSAVDILSIETNIKNPSQMKNLVDILSREADLRVFFPAQLITQLLDDQYNQDLSNVKEVMDEFLHDSDKEKLSQLLRKVAQNIA
ncbi:hypothetical protein NG798_13195 [Ancylothrix sp. C2]|uniref:hypothetical protein n=1 Tax=Ancylothrix sp. D3o TaxID=2953691 RepID=UPI0021BB31A1|nr:hypothetical protein [Ancylothrix sp. D3o]MCT7950751.1 hypothetical protein [Ancylothrix sp. D3o]